MSRPQPHNSHTNGQGMPQSVHGMQIGGTPQVHYGAPGMMQVRLRYRGVPIILACTAAVRAPMLRWPPFLGVGVKSGMLDAGLIARGLGLGRGLSANWPGLNIHDFVLAGVASVFRPVVPFWDGRVATFWENVL